MNKKFLLAAFCSGLISTALLSGCSLFGPKPHSKTAIEDFVTDIDKNATVDYKSREKITLWGRDCYKYDAVIGDIDCQVIDTLHLKDELGLVEVYTLKTNYPYKLCEELWDNVSGEHPDVDCIAVMNSDPDLQLAYESAEAKGGDITHIFVHEEDNEMTKELFDEYWDFYCDLMDAMEDYPEFRSVSLTITNENKDFYIVFLGTDEDEYKEEYDKLFGDT